MDRNESAYEWLVQQLFWVCTTTISAKYDNNCLMFPTHSLLTDSLPVFLPLPTQNACTNQELIGKMAEPSHIHTYTHTHTHTGHSRCCTDNEGLFYRKLTYKMSCMFHMPHCDSDKYSCTSVARMCSRLQPSNQTETFWLHLSNWYIFQLYLTSVQCDTKLKS
jgi:hypothetical protein